MKKVLAIAPYPYLPFFSGGQKFIAKFLEYLGKEVDLTVISTEGNDWSLARNYRGISLLKRSFSRYYDRSLIKKIAAEINEQRYDAVIWEHPYYAWLAFRIRKETGVKTFFHTHNIEYQRFRSTGRWWWPVLKVYEKYCFKKADGIFFITPEDKAFAIREWKINAQKCFDVPFGVDIRSFPPDRTESRNIVREKHGIGAHEKILFFNGLLDYKPNLDALKVILNQINPLLKQQPGFSYKILICGKRLPPEFNGLKDYISANIIYAGFINDIDIYYKASDILLNPVQSGGGIKTKLVESIAYGTTAISTRSGATGIEIQVCGDKLQILDDNDWTGFVHAITSRGHTDSETPAGFYRHYYWGYILERILAALNSSNNIKEGP